MKQSEQIRYDKKMDKKQTISVEASLKNLSLLQEVILKNPDIQNQDKKKLCLGMEEIFVNICNYAYEGSSGRVDFTLDTSDGICMIFEDSGIPFNPLENEVDMEAYDIDFEIGGLGRFLAFRYVDKVEYEYKENKNKLTLIKFKEE